jgi:hypothetical protein
MDRLLAAIVDDDRRRLNELLKADGSLATCLTEWAVAVSRRIMFCDRPSR